MNFHFQPSLCSPHASAVLNLLFVVSCTMQASSVEPWRLAVLIVSKDRAFQLKECLRTLFLFGLCNAPTAAAAAVSSSASDSKHASHPAASGTSTSTSERAVAMDVTVIYAASSPLHASSYDLLPKLFPQV
jgi:hypothetical protein